MTAPPAASPTAPSPVVSDSPSGPAKAAAKFASIMKGDAPAKPAATPDKPSPTPEPEPKAEPKATPSEPKSVVPKLEPLPEKKPEPTKAAPAAEPAKPTDPKKLAHENFKVLEAARDEFRTKWEASEKRAKELEAKFQEQTNRPHPEIEEYKKQLTEYQEREKVYFLERSPEFQKAFGTRIEDAIAEAKEAVGSKNAERLEKILRAPAGEWRNEQLKEFAKELEDDFEKGALRDAYGKLRTAQREREAELAKAGENLKALEQMQEKQKVQAAEQNKMHRERLYQHSLAESAKGLPEFREGEDEAHNAQVAENRAMLKSFLTEDLPPEEFGRMAAWAVRGYRSLTKEKALSDKVAALEGEIAKLSSATPGMDAGGNVSDKGEKADTPAKAWERYKRMTTVR